MALTNVRRTVIEIVNEVERRMGVGESVRLDQRQFTKVLVDLLNDTVAEVSDFGDWQEMYREVAVTASAGQRTYEIAVSAQVKNIHEIHWDNDVAPLENREIETIRRLRQTGSKGTPRQFTVIGVSGVNPLVEVYPAVSTAQASGGGNSFNVAYYKKPRLFATVTADSTATPAFPSRVLVMGLYAKALLEEEGGGATQKYRTAYAEYQRMARESLNRFNADTGTDVYLVPTGKYGGRN